MSNEAFSRTKWLFHPAFRPVLLGVLGFGLMNLLFTLGVTFSPLNQRFNFKYGNFLPAKLQRLQARQAATPNVLFLGTSQTNNGFIPSVFDRRFGHGVKSFNVGLPNNRYDIMLAYLRFHRLKYGTPQLLLVELSPSIQEKNASLYYLPALYYRTLIERAPQLAPVYLHNSLLSENVKQELLASSWSSLRQYRHTFSPIQLVAKAGNKLQRFSPLQPATASAAPIDEEAGGATAETQVEESVPAWVTEAMLAGGWYPKTQSAHMKTPQGIAESVVEARKYYIDQQTSVNFEKLQALLAYCRQENIPVALVSWPNHPAFLKVFRQSRLNQAYQSGLQETLKRYPVMRVDLNSHLPAGQSETEAGFFADPRHLTPDGARLFSEKLAAILNSGS